MKATPSFRTFSRFWLQTALITILLAGAAPGVAAAHTRQGVHKPHLQNATMVSQTSVTSTVPFEMISPGHLHLLIANGLSRQVAAYFFNQPEAMFNLGANGGTVTESQISHVHRAYPLSQIGWLFNSFGTNTLTGRPGLESVLSAGAVPAGVSYVQYDPEGPANGTPAAETVALEEGDTSYITKAAALAHAHGLKFYLTPSVDAGMTSQERRYPSKYSAWLQQDRGAWAGLSGVDMYSIQSQQAEGTATWQAFVPAAIAQAHLAAPAVPVDVGLGINPSHPATVITTSDLENAYLLAARDGAAGYWNNVETGVGADVPATVYVAFFNWLYARLHA